MKIRFEYPEYGPFEVPDSNLLGLFQPKEVPQTDVDEDIIRRAIANPIGTLLLREMVDWSTQVLILSDDITRLTPSAAIIPPLVEELALGGVRKDNIRILIASGTHRDMTEFELYKKLGPYVRTGFPVIYHRWRDEAELRYLGDTPGGTEVWVNKELLEADLIIGIGHIVPHRVAGFSGGGKIIQPGVSGAKTTGQTHWLSAMVHGEEIFGKVDNPVRREIDWAAKMAGLKWVVNVIQDRTGKLVEAVVGDPVAAHRIGAEIARDVYGVRLPGKADIVLTDAYPADLDLWQAAKGIYAADLAVREGGVIILVSPCDGGVPAGRPEILEHGYLPFSEVRQKVEAGVFKDLTVAAHLVHVGRVIREKARAILVTKGLDKEQAEKLGFTYATTIREALSLALDWKGRDAKITVFRNGGEILPIV